MVGRTAFVLFCGKVLLGLPTAGKLTSLCQIDSSSHIPGDLYLNTSLQIFPNSMPDGNISLAFHQVEFASLFHDSIIEFQIAKPKLFILMT